MGLSLDGQRFYLSVYSPFFFLYRFEPLLRKQKKLVQNLAQFLRLQKEFLFLKKWFFFFLSWLCTCHTAVVLVQCVPEKLIFIIETAASAKNGGRSEMGKKRLF